jgi:hypothetical protein
VVFPVVRREGQASWTSEIPGRAFRETQEILYRGGRIIPAGCEGAMPLVLSQDDFSEFVGPETKKWAKAVKFAPTQRNYACCSGPSE